jgi:hypothetical protein
MVGAGLKCPSGFLIGNYQSDDGTETSSFDDP